MGTRLSAILTKPTFSMAALLVSFQKPWEVTGISCLDHLATKPGTVALKVLATITAAKAGFNFLAAPTLGSVLLVRGWMGFLPKVFYKGVKQLYGCDCVSSEDHSWLLAG